MTPIERVLEALDGRAFRKGRDSWNCVCPAHDDRSPSLSVREAGDGRVLLHCFAGCHADAVVAALGLALSDLFPYDKDFGPARNAIQAEVRASQMSEDAWFVQCVKADIEAGKAIPEADKEKYRAILRRATHAEQDFA